jgi:4-amino-4-deoxy-L-arabinose transferase-like glycosyltransferase
MAAGSFKVFGVNEFAGRLPFALAGWLTVGATYAIGRRLVGARAALFGAAALLSCFLFFRFSRLAETDILAAAFVTGAIYFFMVAEESRDWLRRIVWWNLGGACVGLAVLAKGPPAVFAVLFLLAWAGVRGNWRVVVRFLASGAWVTAAVVAGWWFAYVRSLPEWGVLEREVEIIARGSHHNASFLYYFPWTLLAMAPWTAIGILGLAWAGFHMMSRPALRTLLAWGGVIFVPLCLAGQRQLHYLVPLLPAAAVAMGYAVAHGLDEGSPGQDRRLFRWLFDATLGWSCMVGVAILVGARRERGFLQTWDLIVAGVVTVMAVAVVVVPRRRGLTAAVAAYAVFAAVTSVLVFGYWEPTTEPENHRAAGEAIRGRFGDGPYVLYGPDGSDPLLWNLKSVVPEIRTEKRLLEVLRERPETVVIAQTKNNRGPPAVPVELEKRLELRVGDEGMVFRVYSRAGR